MNKNQKGFAITELLLVFIVVAFISGVGWYVLQSKNKADKSFDNSSAVNDSALTKSEPIESYEDCMNSRVSTKNTNAFPKTCTTKQGKKFEDPNPTSDWSHYNSQTGKFTLNHPNSWEAKVCDPNQPDLVLYLGPTKKSSVICNSEHTSQIVIISTSAVPTADEQTMDQDEYGDIKTESVTVDGVKGKRMSGRTKSAISIYPAGSLVVDYIFLTPGRSYIAAYIQTQSGDFSGDYLKQFDVLVKDTLNFN